MSKPLARRSKKTVYLPMAVDIIHHGHINIINIGRELGTVTVGLLTDQAIARYKRVPLSTFEERKRVIENIVGVERVIAQETDDYLPIIKKLKPDFFVHGDDWKSGVQAEKRARVIKTMATWGGRVIEPPYTKGISTTQLIEHLTADGITPEQRVSQLKRILDVRACARIIEAPTGLAASLVERTRLQANERIYEFDGLWLSHRTEALMRGRPESESLDFTTRQQSIDQLLTATRKPLFFELDTTSSPKQLAAITKSLERIGVSAAVLPALKPEGLEQAVVAMRNAAKSSDFCLFIRHPFPANPKEQRTLSQQLLLLQKQGLTGAIFDIDHATLEAFSRFCTTLRKHRFPITLGAIMQPSTRLRATQLLNSGVQLIIHESHLVTKLYRHIEETLRAILLDEPDIDHHDLDAYQRLLTWASMDE